MRIFILLCSIKGFLCFSKRLTAIASSLTRTAGYSFNTSQRSKQNFQLKQEKHQIVPE